MWLGKSESPRATGALQAEPFYARVGIMRCLVLGRLTIIWLLAAALLTGCGGGGDGGSDDSLFAYDDSEPVDVQDAGRINRDYPIAVQDVSFAVPGGRVSGYLVVPPGERPKPAVVYLHGQGGDRSELLLPATWLAARGAVTLAITAPSAVAERPEVGVVEGLQRERDLTVADVVAVRRGLDMLAERPDVDPERLGLVGYSAGARTGAILAGVEPRLDALALMSAGAAPVETYVAQAPDEFRNDVEAVLREIDPLHYVSLEGERAVLLQNGNRDEVVPRDALEEVVNAASGAEVRRYDAGHALNDEAYRDQLEWLGGELEITGAPIAGAQTGP